MTLQCCVAQQIAIISYKTRSEQQDAAIPEDSCELLTNRTATGLSTETPCSEEDTMGPVCIGGARDI